MNIKTDTQANHPTPRIPWATLAMEPWHVEKGNRGCQSCMGLRMFESIRLLVIQIRDLLLFP